MVQRTFTVRLRKDEETGYHAARCVELPEAISQGKTEEEAITNLREALELVLEEYESEAKNYQEEKSSKPWLRWASSL
ncbi:MAG: type II toxin-antitoxin system HicB family antitoxin [Candidatus Bathyarchaeia archaeon]